MLSQKEYESIQRTMLDCNYSPNDFEISTTDLSERSMRLHLEITAVSVQFIPTRVAKTYLSGFGCTWIRELENDLKSGIFDARKK